MRCLMELYAGLDLHSRNTYIGIMDDAFTAFKISCHYFDLGSILYTPRCSGRLVEP